MKVKANLAVVENRIVAAAKKVNRDPKEVTIIAVTKYVSIERTQETIEAGINNLGENYDKGFLEKKALLGDQPTWHFIGSVQSKKVKSIINEIDYLHSLDRISLAEEIQKRAMHPVKCLVQVNISEEESKHGLSEKNVIPFIQQLESYDTIKVVGLMTMAPMTNDVTVIRNCFADLKKLQLKVQSLNLPYATCEELSMGMSNDFEIAIEEGATMIRVGTVLVGEE